MYNFLLITGPILLIKVKKIAENFIYCYKKFTFAC